MRFPPWAESRCRKGPAPPIASACSAAAPTPGSRLWPHLVSPPSRGFTYTFSASFARLSTTLTIVLKGRSWVPRG